MKVYDTLNVSLTYQNFGTSFVAILRGKTEDIETAFNGLFNFGATNARAPIYYNHTKTTAIVWTSREQLRKFFFNRRFIPNMPLWGDIKLSHLRPFMKEARAKLKELAENHEFFLRFADNYMPEPHSVGKLTAERPDNDMKDTILSHAYRDRTGEKIA